MTHQIYIICKIYIDKKPRILEGIYTHANRKLFSIKCEKAMPSRIASTLLREMGIVENAMSAPC